jgi:TRAP-type C4-dicarboxylate transport system substrate-binding protein
VLANKFYEAAPHFAPTNHLVLPMGLFISELTLAELSAPHREALFREARATAVWQRSLMAERNASALVEMERLGASISTIEPAELRSRSIPIQDQVAAKLGVQSLLAKVREAN